MVTYSYDEVGNVETIGYPNQSIVAYTYDAVNRMKTVTDWNGYVTRYTYDAAGNLISTERPDDSILTETYDNAGHLISMEDMSSEGEAICGYNYIYDDDDNIIEEGSLQSQKVGLDSPTYASMEYDAAGRLTNRCVCEYQENILLYEDIFRLDAAGNITEAEGFGNALWPENGPETSFASMTYSWHNHLGNYNGALIKYDHDGNMISGPLGIMTYDSQNRLTQVGDQSYAYDGENNRISSTVDGMTTTYTYDTTKPLSRMLMSETGTDITYYIYGLGLISSYDSYDSNIVYHYDYRGSTVALTLIDSGEVTDRYIYGPYGELLEHTGYSETPFLYNGRDGVMTDGNGLYYMRARYYSPMFMRFINADPLKGTIAENPSQNNYFYANGNPISYIDPFGTSAELSKSEAAHMLLDMGGMIPAVGIIFDAANGVWYVYTGDLGNAGLSLIAIIPVAGDLSKVPKVAKDLSKIEKVIDAATGTEKVVSKNIYNSIKDAPKYPDGFKAVQNGTKKVSINNNDVLNELRQIESGQWKKVYKDGYDANGNKISIHYFESPSGKVFDVKTKLGWSNK